MMAIDWAAFTPLSALAGGTLIGLGTALLLLGNGRIAGISGILGALLRPATGEIAWRVAFVSGLIAAPLLWPLLAPRPVVHVEAGAPALLIAGLLVGLGTRYASGCTSGHGVCGLARLSKRSLVATLVFMASGVLTVGITRYFLFA
ncbi:YeeE/YedE family protein [Rhodocyclus tenuis]|uniref:YeeE/YedE family protein n=2 Tax=Rhodocyclus TaxID=1064 RepID=A0A6L5JVL4_RHOTE|nr:YeeE/YedE family protein [Rhodocyclus gracilis]